MLKVAILDDYQNVTQEFVDLTKLSEKYEIKVFNKALKSLKVQSYCNKNQNFSVENQNFEVRMNLIFRD